MDCSLPGFSVHGILQARTLEWVAISFSKVYNIMQYYLFHSIFSNFAHLEFFQSYPVSLWHNFINCVCVCVCVFCYSLTLEDVAGSSNIIFSPRPIFKHFPRSSNFFYWRMGLKKKICTLDLFNNWCVVYYCHTQRKEQEKIFSRLTHVHTHTHTYKYFYM